MTQGAVKTTGKCLCIVSAKKKAIFNTALDTLSWFDFHDIRLEQIAELAGVSKTGLLYYFPPKEALYITVLQQILDIWLASLKASQEGFTPLAVIEGYIRLRLEASHGYPQASRLFCTEILAGIPLLMDELIGDLKALIDEKSALIVGWVKSGEPAPIGPQHLISIIQAPTQYYVDFAPQVGAVTSVTSRDGVFFDQTVENMQRIITEGIRPRQRCWKRL